MSMRTLDGRPWVVVELVMRLRLLRMLANVPASPERAAEQNHDHWVSCALENSIASSTVSMPVADWGRHNPGLLPRPRLAG